MFLVSILTVAAAVCKLAAAQTYSTCNPLYSSKSKPTNQTHPMQRTLLTLQKAGCPADTALGKAINVDFTQGSVNSFTAVGNPTYDSGGVHFTVAGPGDAPQLASVFYIMFG